MNGSQPLFNSKSLHYKQIFGNGNSRKMHQEQNPPLKNQFIPDKCINNCTSTWQHILQLFHDLTTIDGGIHELFCYFHDLTINIRVNYDCFYHYCQLLLKQIRLQENKIIKFLLQVFMLLFLLLPNQWCQSIQRNRSRTGDFKKSKQHNFYKLMTS